MSDHLNEEEIREETTTDEAQNVQSQFDEQVEENEEEQGCRKCGSMAIEEGYSFPLCHECRTSMARRPVPFKIKAVFALVLMIAFASLVTFPASLRAGVAYQRGIQAAKDKKFITAINEYDKVLTEFPNSTSVLAREFIAYYYNEQIDEASKTFDKISGKKLSDRNDGEELTNLVNEIITKMDTAYYPAQELIENSKATDSIGPEEIKTVLKSYLDKQPNDVFANYQMANYLFDDKKFDEAERYTLIAIQQQPDFISGNLLMASINREKGEYEKALEYSRKVLANNAESVHAYVSMSRIELKRHNDSQGLDLAMQAYALDQESPGALANLALAYHYNNNLGERDKLISQLKQRQDAESKYYLDSLNFMISGKTPERT